MSITTPGYHHGPHDRFVSVLAVKCTWPSIWGGENVRTNTINPLFRFRATDNTHENAAQLTNLQEAQKVGSTMAFRATRLGFRVLWFGAAAPSLAEVEAMKQLFASAVITLTVGSNETKIAEFSGLDLMQPVDFRGRRRWCLRRSCRWHWLD